MTAGAIVGEPLKIHGMATGADLTRKVAEVFEKVGLRVDQMARYPHEFSGGQRQRLSIARALVVNPDVIIADEPVSALDVSIQASVINLLIRLQKEMGLSLLFISHDMSVVEHISHRVAVMYLGRIVETGPRDELFSNPQHPYTEALLSAVPVADPKARKRKRIVLKGDVPSPIDPPSGCHFHTRCPIAEDICRVKAPELGTVKGGHLAACHLRAAADRARDDRDRRMRSRCRPCGIPRARSSREASRRARSAGLPSSPPSAGTEHCTRPRPSAVARIPCSPREKQPASNRRRSCIRTALPE